jgi:hypothetical protein
MKKILFLTFLLFPVLVLSQAKSIEGGVVQKINNKCKGTANSKDLTKDIKFGKTTFVTTTSLVDGKRNIINCPNGFCGSADPGEKYVKLKSDFSTEDKVCCEKFKFQKGKITCVPSNDGPANEKANKPVDFAENKDEQNKKEENPFKELEMDPKDLPKPKGLPEKPETTIPPRLYDWWCNKMGGAGKDPRCVTS